MNARLNLAENLLALGRLDEAKGYFDEVEAVVRDPSNRWGRWRYAQRFFHSFGEYWLVLGDPARALVLADECLELAEQSVSRKNIAKGRRLRGQALLAMGRLDDAENELTMARAVASEVGNPPELWRAHAALGELREAQARPDEARGAYRDAWSVIEGVAAQLTDDALRETFLVSPQVQEIRRAAMPGA